MNISDTKTAKFKVLCMKDAYIFASTEDAMKTIMVYKAVLNVNIKI